MVRGVPSTGLICERYGCTNVAIFRRINDGMVQHICARHTPIGTLMERIEGVGHIQLAKENAPDLSCRSCLTCGNTEITEDMSIQRGVADPWRWWTCILCDSIWMTLPPITKDPELSTVRLAIRFVESKGGSIEAVYSGSGLYTTLLSEGYKLTLDPGMKPTEVMLRLSRRARYALQPPMPVRKLGGTPQVDSAPPKPPPLPPSTRTWRNHLTREVVEVTRQDEAVHFRPLGSVNGAVTMLPEDFERLHEPHTDAQDPPPIEVEVGQEWEDKAGDILTIMAIDGKKQHVILRNHEGIRQIEFRAFKQWRRVTRRNAFDLLIED